MATETNWNDVVKSLPHPPHYQDHLHGFLAQWCYGKPVKGLETGMQTGVSTAALLTALPHGSCLWTVECCYPNERQMRDVLKRLIKVPKGVQWKPIPQRSQDYLQECQDGPLDFFLHDSDHSAACREFEYSWAQKWVRPGGLIISDDYSWDDNDAPWTQLKERLGVVAPDIVLGAARAIAVPL